MSKNSTVFNTFVGEYVSMMTKMCVEQTVTRDEMMETIKTNVSVKGFFIDAADDHYYLGINADSANQAIRIDEVIHIEIVQEEGDLMDQLILSGEVPTEDQFN